MTLVELMISAALGLILLLGISSIFVMSLKVSNRTKGQISLDNQANAVLERIRADVYRAGYLDVTTARNVDNLFQGKKDMFFGSIVRYYDTEVPMQYYDYMASPFSLVTGGAFGIFGCDGKWAGVVLRDGTPNPAAVAAEVARRVKRDMQAKTVAALDTGRYDESIFNPKAMVRNYFTCDEGTGKQGEDSIMLGYQIKSAQMKYLDESKPEDLTQNTVFSSTINSPNEFTGEGYDCEGVKAPDGEENLFVFNSYYLTEKGLYCKGSFGNRGVLISPAVKHLNFRYRLSFSGLLESGKSSTSKASGSTGTGYTSAEWINFRSQDRAAFVELIPNWNYVTAVEVCLVMAGEGLDGSNDRTASIDQVKIPTCDWNPATASYQYVDRDAGDTDLYKRYIATYTVPNLVYASPVGQFVPQEEEDEENGENGEEENE